MFFLMGQIFFFGWYSSDPDQELSGSKVLETLGVGRGGGGEGGTSEEDKILLHSLIALIRFWTKTAKAQLWWFFLLSVFACLFYFILFFLTQCFGSCALDKMRKKKQSLIIFPLPKLK